MHAVHLSEHTWPQAKKMFAFPDGLALLPVGATEAHGPHLPLWTDVYLSIELCERIAAKLRGRRTCIILPPMALAVTNYASGFPGTISLRPETQHAVLNDIVASLERHGVRAVALVNSHLEPAHIGILRDLAQEPRSSIRVLFVDHCRKPWALELTDEFKSGDCHAGAYETSMMLAGRFADFVRMDVAKELPRGDHGLVAKMKAGVTTFEEMGAADAYFGNPSAATQAEGERIYDVLVRMWCETILAETSGLPDGKD